MTVQEVIEYLEQHGFIADEVKDMCIEALVQVEQYRALGTVEELTNQKHNLSVAYKCIEELQQPKTDWIPCEVEMPKTNGVYQTVRKVMEGDRVCYLEGASYFDGQNTWHNDIGVNHGREYLNIVAWQPIQPYKKEGAE